MRLPDFFESDRAAVEAALENLLPPVEIQPSSIHEAMRYSVFAGGKRLRPIMCIESARMFSDPPDAAIPAACAFEFIHTYSLTLAFETLAKSPIEPQRGVQIVSEAARAAGTVRGMIGGQVADLEAERKPIELMELEFIHRSKTAALIRTSIVAGAIAGGAEEQDVERLRSFGEYIGWAFQVVDDILDVEESSAALGKTAGKDQAQQKATYPALLGLERSREVATELAGKALSELDFYGAHGDRLRQLGEFLVARRA